MKTEDEIEDRAVAEHAAAVGKLLKVTYAALSDDSDLRDANYPKSKPLIVRILSGPFDPTHDGNWHDDDGGLFDSIWVAEALPGQLGDEEHVAWIDGPTYFLDGRRTANSWVGEPYEE